MPDEKSKWKYPDSSTTSFIPVATGQIFEIPLSDLDAFNQRMNEAVTQAAAERGVIPLTTEEAMWARFHKMWSDDVGTVGYDKEAWMDLERRILDALKARTHVPFNENTIPEGQRRIQAAKEAREASP